MSNPNQAAINSCRSQIGGLQSRIREIDGQIERLRTALSGINSLYYSNQDFVSSISNHAPEPWLGKKFDDFTTGKGLAHTRGNSYCESIQEISSALSSKISQLEGERLSAFFSIGQLNVSIGFMSLAV